MKFKRINWIPGMNVTSYHLQEDKNLIEEWVFKYINNLIPYNFGVVKSNYEKNKLIYNLLYFQKLEGLLSDGTYFNLENYSYTITGIGPIFLKKSQIESNIKEEYWTYEITDHGNLYLGQIIQENGLFNFINEGTKLILDDEIIIQLQNLRELIYNNITFFQDYYTRYNNLDDKILMQNLCISLGELEIHQNIIYPKELYNSLIKIINLFKFQYNISFKIYNHENNYKIILDLILSLEHIFNSINTKGVEVPIHKENNYYKAILDHDVKMITLITSGNEDWIINTLICLGKANFNNLKIERLKGLERKIKHKNDQRIVVDILLDHSIERELFIANFHNIDINYIKIIISR